MAEDELGHPWAKVIPEFYYDMIARIPAGLVLVLSVVWILASAVAARMQQPTVSPEIVKSLTSWAPAIMCLLLTLVLSYAAGLFLTTIGSWISTPLVCWAWKKVINNGNSPEGSTRSNYKKLLEERAYSKGVCDRVDKDIYTLLRLTNRSALSLLPKVRAEAALAANTFAASLVSLLCVLTWNHYFPFGKQSLIIFVALLSLVLFLSCISIPFRIKNYCMLQLTFLDFHDGNHNKTNGIAESAQQEREPDA